MRKRLPEQNHGTSLRFAGKNFSFLKEQNSETVVSDSGNDSDEPGSRNVKDFGKLLCHHPADRLSVILKIGYELLCGSKHCSKFRLRHSFQPAIKAERSARSIFCSFLPIPLHILGIHHIVFFNLHVIRAVFGDKALNKLYRYIPIQRELSTGPSHDYQHTPPPQSASLSHFSSMQPIDMQDDNDRYSRQACCSYGTEVALDQ